MSSLLQLPMKLVTFAAQMSQRLIEAAGAAVERRRRSRGDGVRVSPQPTPPAAAPAPPAPAPPAPAPPAPAPPPPAVAPPAPAAAAPPPAPAAADERPIAAVPEPTRGEAARIRVEQREAEATDESPGAEVRVDEPWQGYAAMNAPEIIDRLRASDDTVRAVVLLYERSNRGRKTVLRAAGG